MQAAQKRLTLKEKKAQGLEKLPDNRKKRMADAIKADRRGRVMATLSNQAGSPRKYRLIIDLIRGKNVESALGILKTMPQAATGPLSKLVKTAINNWSEKFPNSPVETEQLVIKTITADQSFMLKRIQPAPQGRAHRVRKRYTTINIELGLPAATEA